MNIFEQEHQIITGTNTGNILLSGLELKFLSGLAFLQGLALIMIMQAGTCCQE
jgi:hypothetical protein